MFCSSCGKELRDNMNFCPVCGSAKENISEEKEESVEVVIQETEIEVANTPIETAMDTPTETVADTPENITTKKTRKTIRKAPILFIAILLTISIIFRILWVEAKNLPYYDYQDNIKYLEKVIEQSAAFSEKAAILKVELDTFNTEELNEHFERGEYDEIEAVCKMQLEKIEAYEESLDALTTEYFQIRNNIGYMSNCDFATATGIETDCEAYARTLVGLREYIDSVEEYCSSFLENYKEYNKAKAEAGKYLDREGHIQTATNIFSGGWHFHNIFPLNYSSSQELAFIDEIPRQFNKGVALEQAKAACQEISEKRSRIDLYNWCSIGSAVLMILPAVFVVKKDKKKTETK